MRHLSTERFRGALPRLNSRKTLPEAPPTTQATPLPSLQQELAKTLPKALVTNPPYPKISDPKVPGRTKRTRTNSDVTNRYADQALRAANPGNLEVRQA
jgi:hypothetical protein